MLFTILVEKDEQPEGTPSSPCLTSSLPTSPHLFPLSPQPSVCVRGASGAHAERHQHFPPWRLRKAEEEEARSCRQRTPCAAPREGLWSPSGFFESRGREAVEGRACVWETRKVEKGSLITCCLSVFVSSLRRRQAF